MAAKGVMESKIVWFLFWAAPTSHAVFSALECERAARMSSLEHSVLGATYAAVLTE